LVGLREEAENVSVQTLPGVMPFEITHFIDLGSFKKSKEIAIFFFKRAEFLIAGTRKQGEEVGERIGLLLGDNTRGGAVMLQPIRFQCVGVWISAGLSCAYMQLLKIRHPGT
jgi:hypothetical protein